MNILKKIKQKLTGKEKGLILISITLAILLLIGTPTKAVEEERKLNLAEPCSSSKDNR